MHNKHKRFNLVWWFFNNKINEFESEKNHDIMKYVILNLSIQNLS